MFRTIKTALKTTGIYRRLLTRYHLSRLKPASRHWGIDRGKPIDRIYLEKFLQIERKAIFGNVLEIGGRYYTNNYGGKVEKSVVYDVVNGSEVDIVGDLATGEGLESNYFDCVIILQTLMMIHDIQAAADTIHRVLKPGGSALITVNFLAPNCIDPCHEMWQWNITPNAAQKLISDRFGKDNVEVSSYGNYAAAVCFLAGLAVEDVLIDFWNHEPGYDILIALKATKKV